MFSSYFAFPILQFSVKCKIGGIIIVINLILLSYIFIVEYNVIIPEFLRKFENKIISVNIVNETYLKQNPNKKQFIVQMYF